MPAPSPLTGPATYVVFVARVDTNKRCWAWCEVGPTPGFESVVFTDETGFTIRDLPAGTKWVAERHLFTVTLSEA